MVDGTELASTWEVPRPPSEREGERLVGWGVTGRSGWEWTGWRPQHGRLQRLTLAPGCLLEEAASFVAGQASSRTPSQALLSG